MKTSKLQSFEASRFKVDNNIFDSKLIEIDDKVNFVNYISTRCWKKDSQLNILACMKSESLS